MRPKTAGQREPSKTLGIRNVVGEQLIKKNKRYRQENVKNVSEYLKNCIAESKDKPLKDKLEEYRAQKAAAKLLEKSNAKKPFYTGGRRDCQWKSVEELLPITTPAKLPSGYRSGATSRRSTLFTGASFPTRRTDATNGSLKIGNVAETGRRSFMAGEGSSTSTSTSDAAIGTAKDIETEVGILDSTFEIEQADSGTESLICDSFIFISGRERASLSHVGNKQTTAEKKMGERADKRRLQRQTPKRTCAYDGTYNVVELTRQSLGYCNISSTPKSNRRKTVSSFQQNENNSSVDENSLLMKTAFQSDFESEEFFTPRANFDAVGKGGEARRSTERKNRRKSMTEREVLKALFETDGNDDEEKTDTPTVVFDDRVQTPSRSILRTEAKYDSSKKVHFKRRSRRFFF